MCSLYHSTGSDGTLPTDTPDGPYGNATLAFEERPVSPTTVVVSTTIFLQAAHFPCPLAYPIASLQHEWRPPGYGGAALVPHGFAVALSAPAVFRFIADAVPERCATAARLLDGGDDLAVSLEQLMEDVGAPTRLSEVGYGADDLGALVPGALDQRRLLVGAPKEIGAAELEAMLRASL